MCVQASPNRTMIYLIEALLLLLLLPVCKCIAFYSRGYYARLADMADAVLSVRVTAHPALPTYVCTYHRAPPKVPPSPPTSGNKNRT